MNNYKPYLDWINNQAGRMAELTIKWARINSSSFNVTGLDALLDILERDFKILGGESERVELQGHDTINGNGQSFSRPLGKALRIIKRPELKNRVFLCIHYDTVHKPENGFEERIRVIDGQVTGPGVTDAKGGLAIMLTAVQAFERSPWASNLGWEILINPDEEIGSPGSAILLQEAAKRNMLGLIFEPTLSDGSMVDSRKGSGNFTAVVRGKAAHAGRSPHTGRNAINALAELIVDLNCFAESTDTITLNIGRIEGGKAINVVPDLAIARFNVRVKSPDDIVAVESKLYGVKEMFKSREGFDLEIFGAFSRPPKLVDPDTLRLIDLINSSAKELGIDLSWRHSGGASDGAILAANGLPTVDTLGPRGNNIHSPDEYLILDSLPERARITALVLMKIASNENTW